MLIISHYRRLPSAYWLNEFGIKEQKLFDKVKRIEGDADFSGTDITSLSNLRTIGGNLNLEYSRVKDLGNLETIEKDANFRLSRISNLGNLKTIGGNADFRQAMLIESIDNIDIKGTLIVYTPSRLEKFLKSQKNSNYSIKYAF